MPTPTAQELLLILKMKDEASRELKKAGINVSEVGQQVGAANQNFRSAGAGLLAFGRSAVAVAAGFFAAGGFLNVLRSAINETEQFRQSQIRLNTILEATQYQSGLTRRDINRLVDDLAKATRFDDSALRDAAAALATFENIGSKAFEETLKSATDLASFLDTDIRTATTALGRALQSPTEGLLALRRAGIVFTQNQRDQIKAMEDAGQTAEAQALILQTLQERIGGLAENEMQGLTGAANNLKDAWNDLLRSLGDSFIYDIAVGGLNAITTAIEFLNEQEKSLQKALKERSLELLKSEVELLKNNPLLEYIPPFVTAEERERELRDRYIRNTENSLREQGEQRMAILGEQQARERALADKAAEKQREADEEAAKEAKKAAERIARERAQAAKDAAKAQAEYIAASVNVAIESKQAIADNIDRLRDEAQVTRELIAIQGQSVEQRELSRAMIDAESAARARGFRLTEDEKAAVRDLVAAQQEAAAQQRSFGIGLRDAFEDFREAARDNAALARDAFTTATSSMSSAIDRFVETGKFRIKDMVRSMLADFAKLAANRAFGALLGGILDFAFGSSLPDLGGSAPGIPPIKPSASGRVIRAHSPRAVGYANGGVAVAGESYRNEGILPLARMPSGDLGVQAVGGGNNISIGDINVRVEGQRTPEEAEQIGKTVKEAVESTVIRILQREQRSGGMLAVKPQGVM
jgi:lambda family phage tail tape measure protein